MKRLCSRFRRSRHIQAEPAFNSGKLGFVRTKNGVYMKHASAGTFVCRTGNLQSEVSRIFIVRVRFAEIKIANETK